MENLTNEEIEALDTIEEFLKRVDTERVTRSIPLDMREVKEAFEVLIGEKVKWEWLD